MKRIALLAAAAVGLVACGESPLSPPVSPAVRADPVYTEITGTVVIDNDFSPAAIYLRQDGGQLTRLFGDGATDLVTVDGAQVALRGNWYTEPLASRSDDVPESRQLEPAFAVAEFVVLQMFGRPAYDGVVLEVWGTGSVVLELANGDIVELDECPMDLTEYVGQRIWLIGPADGGEFGFGVIGTY